MSGKAMGFIESVGLASAVTAADAALKAANVELVGRENSRGSGLITIKIVGDVGAVKAAIDVAKSVSSQVARVWSTDVIPRPGEGVGRTMVWNADTQGASDWLDKHREKPAQNLPAIKEDSSLANRPPHDMVSVGDLPKPSVIEPADAPPSETAEAIDTAKTAGQDETAQPEPQKNPPRRKPGNRRRKPK
jgi:microcompartment protein CcmL/EutN